MYDEQRIKMYHKMVIAILMVVVALGGYSVGLATSASQNHSETSKTAKNAQKGKESQLSQSTINQFLVMYYTKQDLGENRKRYKPLMTEPMYQQTVTSENTPVSKAYKGMVIDQKFDQATTYVDAKALTAIVQVSYTNTQLQSPGNLKTALKDQSNHETIKLTFVKEGQRYLVNQMQRINLTELGDDDDTSSVIDQDSSSSSSKGASSSQASDSASTQDQSSDDGVHVTGGL
jgi:lipoprotein-anchoring transpeptidase ErfK/SrfK